MRSCRCSRRGRSRGARAGARPRRGPRRRRGEDRRARARRRGARRSACDGRPARSAAPPCRGLEQRQVLALDEGANGDVGGDDPLAAVSGRQQGASLADRSPLASRREAAAALLAVGIAEDDVVDDRAVLRPAAIEVGSDSLARAGAVVGFSVPRELLLSVPGEPFACGVRPSCQGRAKSYRSGSPSKARRLTSQRAPSRTAPGN